MRSFRAATDLLCLSAPELARIFKGQGFTVQRIRQARLDPAKAGARPPPDGWERALAKLARKRAVELTKLAEELEA